MVGRIDLSSTTETSKSIEHAWAHETHESQHADLGDGVVVVSPPSCWTLKDLGTLRTRVIAAVAVELVDFCLCVRHGSHEERMRTVSNDFVDVLSKDLIVHITLSSAHVVWSDPRGMIL